ncbi:MAG: NfeD family protein [Proteobacteria bacterium]|nr:NfeD family protein [Pseudomonadota bacterium]
MVSWFSGLSGFEQVYYVIAIVSSLFFVLKTVLMMIGIGNGGIDIDGDGIVDIPDGLDVNGDGVLDSADTQGSALHFFSLHGILAFFCMGAWVTLGVFSASGFYILSVFCGFVAGLIMLVVCAYLMRAMLRLESSGNVNTKKAIGKEGEVYLMIPPHEEGKGKVNIELNGKLCEYDAVSLDPMPIKYGTQVRVVDVLEDDVMVVQRVAEELE